jgi:hypothetical protein
MPDSAADLLVILGVSIGVPCIAWMVWEIARNWQKVRVSEHLAALKQSMIERGMSADEIERVINAGVPPKDSPLEQAPSAKS